MKKIENVRKVITWVTVGAVCGIIGGSKVEATPFTTTVPATGVQLPDEYPEAGGVAMVLTGSNGNIYYQFSDPSGAFVGFQNSGTPVAFRGNPFTINDPLFLDCGFRSCSDYFGGSIVRLDVRFSALDGDTQPGGFDEDDISLLINGVNIGSWSGLTTEATSTDGLSSNGFGTGFGNNTFDTGWFSSTNPALLSNILSTGTTTTQVLDDDPNDNFWNFRQGPSLPDEELRTIAPGYELEKTRRGGGTTFSSVGQTITYDYVVRNIGSVDINNITVDDDKIGSVTCSPTELEATMSGGTPEEALCSATYVVTQEDFDAQTLTNIATADGDPEFGSLGTLSDSVTLTGPSLSSGIDLLKEASPASFSGAGQNITYTFTVTNTGNSTLSNVVVTDPRFPALSCTFAEIAPLSALNTDNDETCTAVYTTTQADVDNAALGGTLDNTASVTATDPDGFVFGDTSSVSTPGPSAMPALTVSKSAVETSFDEVGDVLNFEIEVTNTGNVTWTDPVTIDDPLTSNEVCPSVVVAPGGSVTCTASYAVTQADLDAGAVNNTASVEVTIAGETASGSDGTSVNATQAPELEILKSVLSGTATSYSAVTDVITFEFTVTNTGNVTTTSPILVDDPDIGAPFTCGPAGIAPSASVTCTGTWSPDQDDINNGSFTNTANASTEFDGSTVTTATPASATVVAVQNPELTATKVFDAASSDPFAAGNQAVYDYTVVNTGNVTIDAPINVTDNLIGTILCGSTDLLPGESTSCSASYTILANDVALGSVTNLAVGEGTDPNGDPVESDPTSETIPINANPAITVTKVADVTSFDSVGDEIVYTYTVTNTSLGDPPTTPPPALAAPITISDDKFGAPIDCFPGSPSQLLPGATYNCDNTATYTVTQADLDAGFVTNNAFGQTTFGPATVVSDPVQVTVNADLTPSLNVTKDVTAGNDPAGLNDDLTYTINIENDGNQTVSNIAVSDPNIPTLSCTIATVPTAATFTLAPTEVAICTGIYTVTQDDIDAQTLMNTATATGSDPQGGTVEDSGTDAHPLVGSTPSVQITKSLSFGSPASAYSMPGDTVGFVIEVRNNGNVTLASTTVTDVLFPGQDCTIGTLLPGAVDDTTCFFSYTVSQDDIDNGSITNSATATSTSAAPDGAVVTDTDSIQAFGPARAPQVSIEKTTTAFSYTTLGQSIPYVITVTNTGNVTLTDTPDVTDNRIATLSCDPIPVGGLLPSQSIDCTGSYSIQQIDLDTGSLTNTASVSVDDPLNPGTPLTDTDDVTINATQLSGVAFNKVALNPQPVEVGESVTYQYTVENTGNVTLTNIDIVDAHTSSSGTNNLTIANVPILSLAPGATVTRTATYVVTQDDVDVAISLTNTATLSADVPAGAPAIPPTEDDERVEVESADPSLNVIKTVTPPATAAPGEDVVFTINVTNDGNVTLDTISLTDTLTRADASVISPAPTPVFVSGDGGTIGELEVGETWVYRVTHTLTQTDIDAGGLFNSARAFGTDPFNTTVNDTSDSGSGTGSTPTPYLIPPNPGIEGEKTVTSTGTELGDTVVFEIKATNTGNVTLNSVAVASDTLLRADNTPLTLTSGPTFLSADDGSLSGTLKVDETATYRVTYVLTQADIDAGGISNSAVVSGRPPFGSPVTDVTDDGNDADGNTVNDPTVFDIPSDPSLSLSKALSSGGPTFDQAGDVLTYTFTVENTGNVTITDPVEIDDPLITDAGGTISCDPLPLAPNATLTCSGSYTVTQDDVNAGQVDNTATASSGSTDSDPSTETVPALQSPSLEVDKQAVSIVDTSGGNNFDVGTVVSYEYTVTNDGNITLTDAITVDDNLIPSVSCPALPAGGLNPGQSIVCTGDYTVTSDDVDFTSVTNLASATSGTITSPLADETVPEDGTPSLTTTKELVEVTNPDSSPSAGLSFDEVGDVLTYEFTVTNDGEIAFTRDVTVTDDRIAGPIVCFTPSGSNPSLSVGETVTCEADYVVTQDDLNAGEVVNQAFAETLFGPGDTPVVSAPVTETALADTMPSLSLTKSAATLPVTTVGQVLTYSFEIENTGNQALNSVSVSDPLIPALSCDFATLAVGAVETCSATYTVTQDNVDAGSLTNTATVEALTPQGDLIDETDSITVAMPAAGPAVRIEKSASPDPFGPVGSGITYTFEVFNDGNVTLSNLVVTDPIDSGFSCTIPTIAVGTSDTSCFLNVVVAQDDVDNGDIVNTASVEGTDPFGTTVTGTDTITTPSQPASPSLEATKTLSSGGTVAGSVVTYTLTLVNTGDVTLDVNSIVDTMERRGDASATALDAPFGSLTGDTDLDGLLDVTETWTYTATKTIDSTDVDQGGFNNTVTVTATDPFGTIVNDVSDDGNDADGNSTDDPTEFEILAVPALEVTKTVQTIGSMAGDTVVFSIDVVNTGNVTLTDINLTDTLTRADGTDVSDGIAGPILVSPSGSPTSLPVGTLWQYEVSYTLTQEDVNAGGLFNSVTAEGTPPFGPVVSDVSDNGNDTDGNTTNDLTPLVITPSPALDVRKIALPFDDPSAPVFAGDEVQFFIYVENNGNVTLSDLVVTDTLTNLAGDPLTPDEIIQTSGPSATEIAPGEENIYRVFYTLTQADIDSGGVQNSALAEANTPSGLPISDVSDDGDDTDGNVNDDPTIIAISSLPTMTATKTATVPTRLSATEIGVGFTMTVTNTGNVTQTNIAMADDLAAFLNPATLLSTTVPTASGFDGTGSGNPDFNGTTEIDLLTTGLDLPPGATGEVSIEIVFDITDGVPENDNTVIVNSDQLVAELNASIGILVDGGTLTDETPAISATKTVTPETAILGDIVTYALGFTNNDVIAQGELTLIDDLPAGVSYIAGSASIDGTPNEPTIQGRQLQWSPIDLAPDASLVVTFEARVVSGALGELVNRAYALDRDGNEVSNIATAILVRRPEPVFDCGEVIGKVFNDRNLNGYQDPLDEIDRAQITDQTFNTNKFETEEEQPEEGLPNVRVVTVDGTLITTDEFGRFSVPCAALPADIGSNFTLKLDTNSLPTGFMTTTQNPRVARLTPGTITKMNFGAALANVVEIDLLASAFEAGAAAPSQALVSGIRGLVAEMGELPTLVELSYYFAAEGRALAQERLDTVESLLRQLWPRDQRDQLQIERSINRLQ